MNCVVFNHDGSIKNLSFQDIIVQGNTGVDDIYVAVEGYSNDAYTGIALFTLPNGDLNSLIGVTASFSVDGSQYSGYKFTLTSQQTTLAGLVEMSIRLDSASFERQMSVSVTLTINKSGFSPEYTEITMGQYEAMLRTIATLQPKYTLNNVRHYEYLSDAVDDENNIAIGQCVLVSQAPNGPAFYIKDEDEGLVWLCPCGQTFLTFDEEVMTSTPDENTIIRNHPENVVVVHSGVYLHYVGADETDEDVKYYQSIPSNLGIFWLCEVGTHASGTASVEIWKMSIKAPLYVSFKKTETSGSLTSSEIQMFMERGERLVISNADGAPGGYQYHFTYKGGYGNYVNFNYRTDAPSGSYTHFGKYTELVISINTSSNTGTYRFDEHTIHEVFDYNFSISGTSGSVPGDVYSGLRSVGSNLIFTIDGYQYYLSRQWDGEDQYASHKYFEYRTTVHPNESTPSQLEFQTLYFDLNTGNGTGTYTLTTTTL